MASGLVCRANRPNTWLHRPACKREEKPCQLGAVHTWHKADKLRCLPFCPLSEQSGLGARRSRDGTAPSAASMSALLLDGNGELRPVLHLHACHKFIIATLGFENRRFAFLHIEPVLAEGVDYVGPMRDEESVFAFFGHPRQHVTKCGGAPVIFVGRHDETTLGQVGCLLDILEPGEDCRLKGSMEIAGVDVTDRNADLTDRVAKCLRQLFALLVEIALLGDVIEIEGVGISLIRECRAMPDDNDVSARTQ